MGYEQFTQNREQVVLTKKKYRWVKIVLCSIGILGGIAMLILSGRITNSDENLSQTGFLMFFGFVLMMISVIILFFTEKSYRIGQSMNVSDKSIDRNQINSMQTKNSYRYPGSEQGPKV